MLNSVVSGTLLGTRFIPGNCYRRSAVNAPYVPCAAQREYETVLGDYKEVAGCFIPFSIETNVKGEAIKDSHMFVLIL